MNKVTIIGTVGIPAKYGGFETLVEYLTKEKKVEDVEYTVFCSSSSYSHKKDSHNGAKLIYLPFKANGIQSVIYDIISIVWSLFIADTILVLGVSGAVIFPLIRLFYKGKIVTNIDGLEHKRDKWGYFVRRFLKFSERLAVKYSNCIVTDNKAIHDYVKKEYGKESVLIAYGADHVRFLRLSEKIRLKYNLPTKYAFKVCRIEPENNIHIILEAFSKLSMDLVMVGNWSKSQYGIDIREKYSTYPNIRLLDPIYDQDQLNQIRSNCSLYIHGHSAGGTNPSLVEAMYLSLPILAFDVAYNRYTTNNSALYFKDSDDLIFEISSLKESKMKAIGTIMKSNAEINYTWSIISQKYLDCFC